MFRINMRFNLAIHLPLAVDCGTALPRQVAQGHNLLVV